MRVFSTVVLLSAAISLRASGEPAGRTQELETVRPTFQHPLPNIPGKNLAVLLVSYPPGGRSPPHRHASSAFIFAYVLKGTVRSRVGAEPAKVYRAGEFFFEEPGAHHWISENASNAEPARLLAIFVVDGGDKPLTTPDSD